MILPVRCWSISDRLQLRFGRWPTIGKRPVRVTLTKAMSTNLISSGTTAREKVNLRTPDVMAVVQAQVESHYRSDIVEKVRREGGTLTWAALPCVSRSSLVFATVSSGRSIWRMRRAKSSGSPLFIVGEIIHNPEVNDQIAVDGIKN